MKLLYLNSPDILPARGFTGHEWLPWFNLYNMNGRLYDPTVGRFLSPDPYVTDATSTQEYNRYSYCLNNPLKYTDPSGYKKKYKKEEESFDIMNYVYYWNSRIGGGGYARQNYSNSLNYKFGQMSNSYFWDQLQKTIVQLPDGESSGAGAVWEVYIEDKESSKEFEKSVIKLINIIEETKILGKGIKPIRMLFEKNLR